MDTNIALVGLLLLVAAIVAIGTRRLGVPYSVGLVAAGVGLAVSPLRLHLPLSRDLIFSVFLPPIVFEAALLLKWADLKRNSAVLGLLATIGVVVSAAVVAAAMHWLGGWGWAAAALFGALIAATDPVSVIATFKSVKIDPRLQLLVESESLMNDGTAAVLFAVVLGVVAGSQSGVTAVAIDVVRMVGGGIAIGAVVAGGLLLLAGRTNDVLVELTLTTLMAYGSFLIADRLDMSGVLATLTAGLIAGNSAGGLSANSRGAIEGYWDYVAFLANSLIFLLLGAQVAEQPFAAVVQPAALAIIAVIVARAVAIYGLSPVFARTRLRIDRRHQHVLVWGGLRGALALGLAFGLPADLPGRGQVVTVAFAVVAFSIVVQGLTMTPLLRWLRLIGTGRGQSSKV